MTAVVRGRLLGHTSAPGRGERVDQVVRVGGVLVEQILSGVIDGPVEFLQDHDEWVVVLGGGAVLEVDGEPLELGPGDWCCSPPPPLTASSTTTPAPTGWPSTSLPRSGRTAGRRRRPTHRARTAMGLGRSAAWPRATRRWSSHKTDVWRSDDDLAAKVPRYRLQPEAYAHAVAGAVVLVGPRTAWVK